MLVWVFADGYIYVLHMGLHPRYVKKYKLHHLLGLQWWFKLGSWGAMIRTAVKSLAKQAKRNVCFASGLHFLLRALRSNLQCFSLWAIKPCFIFHIANPTNWFLKKIMKNQACQD